ncbi:Proteinaceous RNase P 1 chloroplastic/mitochondrial [Bienertia sinuspersici]
MKASGISPKLRSYGPALFGFCEKGDADGAYKVDAHMLECGVVPEELELRALLKVSVDARRGDKVYEMLHRLRTVVRQVSEETARLMVDWFESETASGIGVENWDMGKVKEGVVKGGGGWHGQGWLGSGKWSVVKAEMDKKGVCCGCGEKLVCIDIDPKETESFATSLSSLACEKEKRVNFLQFQEWLKTHGPFDAVVDGANVGLINTHNFSFRQLINVVNQLQNISPSKKLPLIILHRSRVYGGPAKNPNTKRLLESWMKAGALYATPQGSNDDWYWLYAAVSSKCLLVTNDEMRDHLFQLLGNSIFPRWKEKHQVRMTVSRSGLALHMPPPYSIVIQESETGSWHIPTVIEIKGEMTMETVADGYYAGDPAKQDFAGVLFSYADSFHKAVTSSFKEDGINAETGMSGAAFDYIEDALSKFNDGPFFLGQFGLVDIAYARFSKDTSPSCQK